MVILVKNKGDVMPRNAGKFEKNREYEKGPGNIIEMSECSSYQCISSGTLCGYRAGTVYKLL